MQEGWDSFLKSQCVGLAGYGENGEILGQDYDKYQRLIALAGWMWARRDSTGTFRQSDLVDIRGFEQLGSPEAGGRKALNRALEDLREFGISVEWDPTIPNERDLDAGGAYRITGMKLSPAEQKAVLDLGFTIRYNDLSSESASRIPGSFLEGAAEGLMLESARFIGPLSRAMHAKSCIEARYGQSSQVRVVQPIRLGYSRGQWYVAALDLADDGALKVFRIDRFTTVEDSDADWNDGFDLNDADRQIASISDRFSWGDEEDKVLRLSVEDAALPAVMRLFPDSTVEGVADRSEWSTVTRTYRNSANVLDAVVSLGSWVVVQEPPELRAAVVGWLGGIAEAGA